MVAKVAPASGAEYAIDFNPRTRRSPRSSGAPTETPPYRYSKKDPRAGGGGTPSGAPFPVVAGIRTRDEARHELRRVLQVLEKELRVWMNRVPDSALSPVM